MSRLYDNIVNNLYQSEISSNSYQSFNRIVKSSFVLTDSFYRKDINIHKACVNAIKFSDCGNWLCSGGDDLTVQFSNVEQSLKKNYNPLKCKLKHRGNIFCLTLNHDSSKVFSGGTDQLIIHDTSNGDLITSRFLNCSAISDISINPQNDNILAIGSKDGLIHLFDNRSNSAELTNEFQLVNTCKSIQYNPAQSHLLLVASNCERDVSLIDFRNRKFVFSYHSPFSGFAMAARYNSLGNQILVMRNRLCTSLYNSNNPECICEFDNFGYYSTITQKSPCFAGPNDEFICVPSDDFSIYLYKIPDELSYRSSSGDYPTKFINSATHVLKGHRSIVNQVQYNYKRSIIATSGVENVIKYWSPFPLSMDDKPTENDFSSSNSNDRFINYTNRMGLSVLDLFFDEESTSQQNSNSFNENTAVMNFFDHLLKRDLCEDDSVDFINFSGRNSIKKLKDHIFESNINYIRSLISDFKENNDNFKKIMIEKIKSEQAVDKKHSNMLTTRSISYLYNHKKIKQSKIIIKRSYQLIQDRLRFIRDLKKDKFNNQPDEWYCKVESLIDSESEFKKMLINLNEMYKDKRALENISSPLYCNLIEQIIKIRLKLEFLPNRRTYFSSNDESNSSHDVLDNDLSEEESSDDDTNETHQVNETDESIVHSKTDNSRTTDSDSDISLMYGFTMSEDSLSPASVLNDKITGNEGTSYGNDFKNLKRKKFKLKPLCPLESSDDSESSCDIFPKLKKSRNDKTERYNSFAFDSDMDATLSADSND